ncbi:MAG: glycosyltransferase family 9 protein [Phycisphaerales bacterium]|nr:MAG: glycosyltransferase family 9 protein [Phycisphaerales bacterium]
MVPPLTPQRILIVRPSALGDVCRTVPVLASLRRAFPEGRIDWLVQDDFAPAVAAHPDLTDIIGFPRAAFGRWWRSPRQAGALFRWARELRRRRYDLAIDCQGLGRSGLFTWLTFAPRRVGHRGAREFAWMGYSVRHPRPESPHTVDRMLSLLESEGIEPSRDMRLYLSEADRLWWTARRAELGIADAPYAVLAPTARWPSKRWPIERWGELIRPLLKRGFEKILITGSPGEVDQVRGIKQPGAGARSDRLVDMVGAASIGQTMALIARAGLVVANDSAPLHMAVGFNRRLVALFGPTEPASVGPYRREECVVRGFRPHPDQTVNFKDPKLGDSLMRLITVEDVLARVDEELAHEPPATETGGGLVGCPAGTAERGLGEAR